jgi:uncharacterized oxidoreductase
VARSTRAMPLDAFIVEVTAILRDDPAVKEVVVERCKPLRFAAEMEKFDATFHGLNEAVMAAGDR